MSRTITIYAYLRDTLETRIDRANRRAQRIGQPGYTLTITHTDPEPVYAEDRIHHWVKDDEGHPLYPVDMSGNQLEIEYYRERVSATIDGIVPKLPGGWQFVGYVDEDPQIGPMPKMITDEGRALNVNL